MTTQARTPSLRRQLVLGSALSMGLAVPARRAFGQGQPAHAGVPSGAQMGMQTGMQTGMQLGVLPNVSARVLFSQYQPLGEYLQRHGHGAVQVTTAPNWQQFHQRTLSSQFDVVVTAAHLGRLAQVERRYVPLGMMSPHIKGLMVQVASAPLIQLNQLSGKTVVLSNPPSLVALQGMRWMANQGLVQGRDFTATGVATDDSLGAVLLRGDAAAAILSGGEFRAIPETQRAQLKLHTQFAEVPGFVVMANPRLGSERQDALRRQLMALTPETEDGRIFFTGTGFTGIRPVPTGLLESMDAFSDATRRALS